MAEEEVLYGRVVSVQRLTEGDRFAADAAIGATVLSVFDTADFDEDGGQVRIGADVYDYSSVDDEANTVTLTSGLLVAALAEDALEVIDAELNDVVVEYVADILLDGQDSDDDPIEVTVQQALVDFLSEAVRGGASESVTLERDGEDDWQITQLNGRLANNIAVEAVATTAGSAMDAAVDALNAASAAANFAESKNRTFRQGTAPVSDANYTLVDNDTWFNTADGNRPWTRLAGAWVDARTAHAITPNGKLVLAPGGLYAYNSGGSPTFSLDANTGNLTTSGAIASGGELNSATVTGGQVQTTSTPNRGIKMNTTHLIGYDSVGNPVFSLDATTGAATFKGSVLSGSSITGASFATATSGARVELSGSPANEIRLWSFGAGETSPAKVYGSGAGGTPLLVMQSPQNFTGRRSAITLTGGSNPQIDLAADATDSNSGYVVVSGVQMNVNSLYGIRAQNGMTVPAGGITVEAGGISVTGGLTVVGSSNVANLTATGAVHGNSIWADEYSGGSLSGADIGADGKLRRTTSARRYKHAIEPADFDLDAFLALVPVTYRRNDEPDEPRAGFIADEVAEAGLREFVGHNAEGEVDTLRYADLTAPLLALCQRQQAQIDDLTARLDALEAAP